MLIPQDGGQLLDYKFFCFNGKPEFVEVDFDCFTAHTRNFYSLAWERLPLQILYPPYQGDAERPNKLDEMIDVAKKLSKDFPFIRVDLYTCDDRVYFGELTFHPEGGFGPILPNEWDEKLGGMLELPILRK